MPGLDPPPVRDAGLPAADSAAARRPPLVAWVFTDGKPGHENQSIGLTEAVERLAPVQRHVLPALSPGRAISCAIGKRCRDWAALPRPGLIIGAGHRTHLSILAAGRITGGRTVVLMRPSLPWGLFDLCLVPRHDDPPQRENIVPTTGAINRIRPSASQRAHRGLFLIGGPSRHHGWDDARMIAQIMTILESDQSVQWTLTTSRRTPASFVNAVAAGSEPSRCRGPRAGDGLNVVPASETPPGWVGEQLARCGRVWVSEDSVSMIYEALSSGAAVGVLEVPRRSQRRAAPPVRGIDELVTDGLVMRFAAWRASRELPRPRRVFNEAERCARLVLERFTPSRLASTPELKK